MATASGCRKMEPRDFQDKMSSFPCMFNMPCYTIPMRGRLKNRKDQLSSDLEKEFTNDEEEKKVRNTLTWILYTLGLKDCAEKMNAFVLKGSENQSVVALANCVFMSWLDTGRVSEHFLSLLDEQIHRPDFNEKVLAAKAEQAYCLGQLGDLACLMEAVNLYEHILSSREDDHWRYLLGLTFRRMACNYEFGNQSCNQLMSETTCHEKAKECFEKVARCSDPTLLASSLINLACFYTKSKQAIITGVESAVTIDQSSEVCWLGGRALLNIDLDRAVTLLEMAMELSPERSVSYHHLGRAYARQYKTSKEINIKNEIGKKAERTLRKSYEVSNKLNTALLMDLVRLLKTMGDVTAAKEEAMALISSRNLMSRPHTLLLQGHHFLFQLYDCDSDRHMLLFMLTSIHFINEKITDTDRNAIRSAIFQGYHEVSRNEMNHSTIDLRNILRSHRYDKINRIIGTISECVDNTRNDVKKTIHDRALKIAEEETNEEALLFLQLVSFHPRINTFEFKLLHIELLLIEAVLCLNYPLTTASLFFRQAFDLIFRNKGTRARECESTGSDASVKLDILVLFNDSIDRSRTSCWDTTLGLEDAISCLFNLRLAINPTLQASREGEQDTSLASFIQAHMIDVILVVFEGDESETEYLLDKLDHLTTGNHSDDEDRSPLIVAIQCGQQTSTDRLPAELKEVPCLRLGQVGDEFPNYFGLKESQHMANQSWDTKGVMDAYFHGNVGNVTRLFNHLTQFLSRKPADLSSQFATNHHLC